MSTATVTDEMLADELARVLQAGAGSVLDRDDATRKLRNLLRLRFAVSRPSPPLDLALAAMLHAWMCSAADPAARAGLDPDLTRYMDATSAAAEAALERVLELLMVAKPEGGAA